MVDAAVRLLSLVNQLQHSHKTVTLEFADGMDGTMGYLNRIGFFDFLSRGVNIMPARPTYSGAQIYSGANAGLMEIVKIDPSLTIPSESPGKQLSNAVLRSCAGTSRDSNFGNAIWSIFSELIKNIYRHAQSPVVGFAAVQVYKRSGVRVAVSDSGIGILDSLRPALHERGSPYATLSDKDLLVQILEKGGLSRDEDGGLGLHGSAGKAMKYGAKLQIRLQRSGLQWLPQSGINLPNRTLYKSDLPVIWGTHLVFDFKA